MFLAPQTSSKRCLASLFSTAPNSLQVCCGKTFGSGHGESNYVLTFHGERCPDGAEIIPAEMVGLGDALRSGRRPGTFGERIRYRSNERVHYSRRLEAPDDPLVLEFINTLDRPAMALVDFVSAHGLIFEKNLRNPDELETNYITRIRSHLATALRTYEGGDLSTARSWFRRLAKIQLASLRPDIVMRDGGLALTLPIDTLFGFMLMETALIMTGGSQVMRCAHCGTIFISGSGTGRRNTALYCTNRCRVAAQRAARKKGGHS